MPPSASAPWTAEADFNAVDGDDRGRDFAVVVPTLAVVETQSVEQDQRLAEGGAAQTEVRLHVPPAARTHVESGHKPQRFGHGTQAEAFEIVAGDRRDRATDGGGRDWGCGCRHHYIDGERSRRLGERRRRGEEADGQQEREPTLETHRSSLQVNV